MPLISSILFLSGGTLVLYGGYFLVEAYFHHRNEREDEMGQPMEGWSLLAAMGFGVPGALLLLIGMMA